MSKPQRRAWKKRLRAARAEAREILSHGQSPALVAEALIVLLVEPEKDNPYQNFI